MPTLTFPSPFPTSLSLSSSLLPRPALKGKGVYDEKNIRRRVYDALNVLMAMDIISKEKKEISWKGLPSNAQHDLDLMGKEREGKEQEVKRKRSQLKELLKQGRGYRMLREHNERREQQATTNEGTGGGASTSSSTAGASSTTAGGGERIPLPFIVVSTDKDTQVQCEMGSDRTDVFFNFSNPFEINDDNEILRRMGFWKKEGEENEEELGGEGGDDIETYFTGLREKEMEA